MGSSCLPKGARFKRKPASERNRWITVETLFGAEEMSSHLPRFLLVGFATVGTDFVIYLACATLLPIAISKAVGFVCGSVFAYVANKTYTFQSSAKHSKAAWRFCLVYMLTLFLNVTLNDSALLLIGSVQFANILAFLVATSVSALTNFCLLKFFVFQTSKQTETL